MCTLPLGACTGPGPPCLIHTDGINLSERYHRTCTYPWICEENGLHHHLKIIQQFKYGAVICSQQ